MNFLYWWYFFYILWRNNERCKYSTTQLLKLLFLPVIIQRRKSSSASFLSNFYYSRQLDNSHCVTTRHFSTVSYSRGCILYTTLTLSTLFCQMVSGLFVTPPKLRRFCYIFGSNLPPTLTSRSRVGVKGCALHAGATRFINPFLSQFFDQHFKNKYPLGRHSSVYMYICRFPFHKNNYSIFVIIQ